MTKSILESLTIKTNKSELEQMEELILSSIDSRISDMRAFVDIYIKCELADRKRIAETVIWEIIAKLDEVEELNNTLDQLSGTNQSIQNTRSYINHLNLVNLYNYDDAIEEINLATLPQKNNH